MNVYRLRSAVALAFAVALLWTPIPALAQSARLGGTFFPTDGFPGGTRRFPSVAYDAASDSYLVAWGIHQIGARFIGPHGAALGPAAQVSAVSGIGPGVACGVEINACLIAWVQEPTGVIGRLVRNSGGTIQPLGDPFVIHGGTTKLTSSPIAVAYSPAAGGEFLVAWTEFGLSTDVRGRRVSAAGTPTGNDVIVASTTLWEGMPSMTYNTQLGQYVVSYYYEPGLDAVGIQRVAPGSGALIGTRSTVLAGAFHKYPEIAYNSVNNQYLLTTWGFAGGWMLSGRLADGTTAEPLGLSPSLALAAGGGGDGIGVTYNSNTNTYFAVYLSQANNEVWGVEVNANGVPNAQFQVTAAGTRLATQPRAAASTKTKHFLAVGSDNYARVMGQMVGAEALPGGPNPGPPPPPPPPASNPRMWVDTPANNATVSAARFVVAGWALDSGATSGTGVDAVHVWAYPLAGGQPVLVGAASLGVARPDLVPYVGAQFASSGYELAGALIPGAYDLAVFAHSSVTGTFNNVQTVRVNVAPSASNPRMWIDIPAADQVLPGAFIVAGWALDLGAPTGTGVDAVHVWAYPLNGAPPIPVGGVVAEYGSARPDVAGFAGAPRFTNCGFRLVGSLPPGVYHLVVFAHSTVAGTFNNVAVKPITIQ